jgi:nitrite reductase/ring-hydroxylating ferredoxin subunit
VTTTAPSLIELCAVGEARDGAVTSARAGRTRLAVVNVGGAITVFLAGCPHHGGPLDLGKLKPRISGSIPGERTLDRDHPVLVCPWHNYEFDPGTGCSLFDERLRLRAIPHEIQDGKVCVQWPPNST